MSQTIVFDEHGLWLLPRRLGLGTDPEQDALWDAAQVLVNEGRAEWISPVSCLWPGIREVRRQRE